VPAIARPPGFVIAIDTPIDTPFVATVKKIKTYEQKQRILLIIKIKIENSRNHLKA
jgi:hypothetical protein